MLQAVLVLSQAEASVLCALVVRMLRARARSPARAAQKVFLILDLQPPVWNAKSASMQRRNVHGCALYAHQATSHLRLAEQSAQHVKLGSTARVLLVRTRVVPHYLGRRI